MAEDDPNLSLQLLFFDHILIIGSAALITSILWYYLYEQHREVSVQN